MKVLVLGGGGQVARAVAACVPAGHTVIVRSRAELDISNQNAVTSEVRGSGVQWIINGAAYTAVDRAESDPDAARAVNETAVGLLANVASRVGCRLLHLSTDFVFDGASNRAYLPDDKTNPLGLYGLTKLGGEKAALQAGHDVIILRTAWVYAAYGRNFVLTMLRLMGERDEVRVVCDQIGAPTWASSIARAIWAFITRQVPGGIYHWTDLGVASWYDFAVAIQEEALALGLLTRSVPIVPISTLAYPTPAQRPAFSVLDTEATRSALEISGRHWRTNLRMMLDELRTA